MLIKVEGEKYNFIDEKDLYVGYDTSTDCCEYAGWYITDKPTKFNDSPDIENTFDVKDYVFDVVGHVLGINFQVSNDGLDEGSIVVFRLLHPTKPPLYLHLFNCHNGYYGHSILSNLPYKHETNL